MELNLPTQKYKMNALLKEIEDIPEGSLDHVISFVRFIKWQQQYDVPTTLLSEQALAKDWLEPEEDEAWQDL